MLGLMLLAAAAGQGTAPEATLRAWRTCIGDTTRVAARADRPPEEMPALLHQACPDQQARYARALAHAAGNEPSTATASAAAQQQAFIAEYVRRYAFFHATGLWPDR